MFNPFFEFIRYLTALAIRNICQKEAFRTTGKFRELNADSTFQTKMWNRNLIPCMLIVLKMPCVHA